MSLLCSITNSSFHPKNFMISNHEESSRPSCKYNFFNTICEILQISNYEVLVSTNSLVHCGNNNKLNNNNLIISLIIKQINFYK